MSANPKEKHKKYMECWRLPKRLHNYVKKLENLVWVFVNCSQDCVNDSQKNVNTYSQNCVKVSQDCVKILGKCSQNCVKVSQDCVKILGKCSQDLVKFSQDCVNDSQKNVNENSENGSKTTFLAISGENSDRLGEGGGRGGVGDIEQCNRTSNCTEYDVKRTIYLKEKNTKKRKENLQKNLNYSADFLRVWSFYPRTEGTSKIKAFEAWENSDLPDVNFLLAVLFFEKDKEQWQEEKRIPHLSTWINQRRWESYNEAKVRSSIKYRELCGTKQACAAPAKIDEEKEAREKILKKVQRYKEIINNKKVKLPTENEWAKMNSEERITLAKKYEGYTFDEVSSAVFYKDLDQEAI